MKTTLRQHGFSLIEVMVATVLLMVIVTMVALVYRQNVLMWNSGMRRADGMALVRLALGNIERDMRNAVSGTDYAGWNGGDPTDKPLIYMVSNTLTFLAFLGDKDSDERELVRITYTSGDSLERIVEPLYWNNLVWSPDPAKGRMESTLIDKMKPQASANEAEKPQLEIEFIGVPRATTEPTNVIVKATLRSSEEFASIRVKSLGEKGDPENKSSHIVVW